MSIKFIQTASQNVSLSELRAFLSVALGVVLILAATLWMVKTIRARNGHKQPLDMEAEVQKRIGELTRKHTIAGEQTTDWWSTEIQRICTKTNDELQDTILACFDERFHRLERMLKGEDNVLPFNRADWVEMRKRRLKT